MLCLDCFPHIFNVNYSISFDYIHKFSRALWSSQIVITLIKTININYHVRPAEQMQQNFREEQSQRSENELNVAFIAENSGEIRQDSHSCGSLSQSEQYLERSVVSGISRSSYTCVSHHHEPSISSMEQWPRYPPLALHQVIAVPGLRRINAYKPIETYNLIEANNRLPLSKIADYPRERNSSQIEINYAINQCKKKRKYDSGTVVTINRQKRTNQRHQGKQNPSYKKEPQKTIENRHQYFYQSIFDNNNESSCEELMNILGELKSKSPK